ncbi:MAG: T9SS type A sorting domain-containing protein [Saprospiraceae bacterium]|nr:T9SS type A sorting domain-containing protein [Saprospiraceae bacterium]
MVKLSNSSYFIILQLLFVVHLHSQVLPALPNTADVVICFPDTTGYNVITVGPIGRDYTDLQEAIDAAELKTVIVLDAGEIFYGGFVLPDKGEGEGWIIITSSRMDILPGSESRIQPMVATGDIDFATQTDAMAKIVTNNLSGIPCFKTQAYAHHYWLAGLEITADIAVVESYGLINLGDGSSAQNTLSEVPHDFVIDRCYIHGHSVATVMKYGVRLDCQRAAIIDSHISDFHSIGFDAQAIACINGPGPFKIINNYLEASGENILIGGAAPAIPGLVPSDIEVRQNYFYKPWSWRVGDPTYAGKHWTIKNLFELKTGKRVWLDGNTMENCWADLPIGQSGYAIMLTVRTEGGNAPQADVSDVLITNNIIRHVGAGIAISGSDDGVGIRSSRIRVSNNLFEDINGPIYGDQNVGGPNDGTFLKIGKPKDVMIDHNTIFQSGPITWAYDVTDGFIYTDNISNCYVSAGGYQGIYGPGQSQGNNTIAHYFPDVSDANQHFHKNVLIGGNASKYTNYSTISQNYFPTDIDAVKFVDYLNGLLDHHGYALSTDSPFYQFGSDGKDIGINIQALDSAFLETRDCQVVTSVNSFPDNHSRVRIYPNPVLTTLHFDMEDIIESEVIVQDLTGRILIRSILDKNRKELNVEALLPGAYIISVLFKDGCDIHLIVVQ